LANTLEDLSHISVFMLIGAVDNNDENTESSTKILYGFCFTSTGRSSWSSTIEHTKSLGQCDIASISERSDTKSLLSSQEFIGVSELNISDSNTNMLIILSPVASCVLSPCEIICIFNLILDAFLSNFSEDFELSYMDCYECLNSSSQLLVHFFKTHLGQITKNLMQVFLLLFKLGNLLFVASLKAFTNIECPQNLDTEKGNLRWISEGEVSSGHRVAILGTLLASESNRGLHRLFKSYEPVLNVTFSLNLIDQLDLFLAWSHDRDNFDNQFSVCLIESDSVDGIEKLLEIILDSMWVRSNR
jgi:hypothetical protein